MKLDRWFLVFIVAATLLNLYWRFRDRGSKWI